MCAVVLPERWDAVREVCERWGLPVAVIGRVTADGDITVVDGRPRRRRPARAGRPGAGAHPGPRPDQRRDRPPADRRAAPTHRRGAPAPGAPDAAERPPAGAGHGPGRGPAGPARVGRTSPRATPSSTSTTRRSGPTRSPARAAARPSCGSRARRRRSSRRPTATQAVGALDPWLGAALSVAEATRNVSITGARPLGVTNCLNYGDPTRPEAFWQLSEGVRGLGRRVPRARAAGHRRQRLALQRVAGRGRSRRRAEIGVVGLLDDVATLVGPAFARRRRRDPRSSARRRRASPARAYADLAGVAAGGRPAGARPRARGGAPGVRPRGDRARARRVGPGRLGRRPRGRPRRVRDVGRARAPASALPVAHSPAVDLFGESPSRLVVTLPAALRRGARAARPPARPAGRDDRVGRRRPPGRSSWSWPARRAPPRSAAARVADALDVPLADLRHAWDHGLARALGWEG